MNVANAPSDARAPVRILTIVVVLTTLAALGTIGVVARSATTDVVQGREVDLAGQQRRLSERVAYDISELRADPGRDDIRAELRTTSSKLEAIHTGLLAGSSDLGIDGEVPDEFRELYSSTGLDLDDRLRQFEQAASLIAESTGEIDPATAAVISAEASGQRLVRDLDLAVAALASTQARQTSTRARNSVIGLFVSCLLGVAALFTLFSVRHRLRAQVAARDALAAEIANSEELYRTTVDSLVDGVVIQDEHGNVVRTNEAARRIIAAHLDGALPAGGQNFADFLPQIVDESGHPLQPDDRPIARALAGPGPVVGMIIGLPLKGGLTWFRCNATATKQLDDRGRRVVLTFADITAERAMAIELSDQERRFRLALEHAPIGMALVALDGEFITVNTALCELTGRGRDQLFTGGLFGLGHPDDPPTSRADLQSLVTAGNDATSSVHRILAADGSTVHVRIAVSVVRPDAGTEPYLIVEFLDITETLRTAEAQQLALAREREAVAKLIELDDARSTFVSTVSHELRTPLTSLVGYLELLDDGTAGSLTGQQHRMVDAAVRNGDRLGRLIDDLLTMTTAERVDAQTRTDRVPVGAMIVSVVETMSPLAVRGGVALSIETVDPGAVVTGDRSQLERVLMNVVGNAVKFTPAGGTVQVHTACRFDQEREIEIRVVDTGVGIPEQEHPHLFTRFFRSQSAQNSHVPGTGLGLAIAERLIAAHGGRIDLASVEHRGTTVTITLPLASSAVSGAAETSLVI